MLTCLIDVRILQDPAFDRDRVALDCGTLLRHARGGLPGVRVVALCDPMLPPLAPSHRDAVDDVRHSGYTGALGGPCMLVRLSPMTHDPLFVVRLLHHPAVPSAAVVHELPDPVSKAERLLGVVALRWMAPSQLFLVLSGSAGDGLCSDLSLPGHRMCAIGPLVEAGAVERFWSAVRGLVPGQAPGAPRARPRIAFVTPLPPDAGGAAAYNDRVCTALSKRVAVAVFTPTAGAECPAGVASLRPVSARAFLSSGYDRVVSVLAGSQSGGAEADLFARYGGAAILHGTGLPVSQVAAIGKVAEPLMMHSAAGSAAISERDGIGVVHLPLCVGRVLPYAMRSPAWRQAARTRLGFDSDAVLLVSFGDVHPMRAPIECVWTLDLLRAWGFAAYLHFVGRCGTRLLPVNDIVEALGLARFVRYYDARPGTAVWDDHLSAVDVALQLRTGVDGTPSTALSDCIAAGVPTVAPAASALALQAPDYVRRVPDMLSPVLVGEATVALLDAPCTMPARDDYARRFGMDAYAARLCAALGLP